MVAVTTTFKNGSESLRTFKTWDESYRYANENISYSNDTRAGVDRVCIKDEWGERAVYDSSWNDESNSCGLKMPM